MDERTCAVDGCSKPPRSGSADWCKMHYHRWYRHGDTSKTARKSGVSVTLGRRYVTKWRPSHPLASKHGIVYVHRATLYDTIGPGPHPCHWCGHTLDWLRKGEPDAIEVDHLNAVGDDNRPDNLVPSCQSCNIGRAQQARAEALRQAGWWAHHDTIARLTTGQRRSPVDPTADHDPLLFGPG